jgi:RNA polymerase subunit RPABC4/transcription elongation factor Spt4
MAKNRRGKGLVKVPNHGRGVCPVCERTGIKLVWEIKDKDGEVVKVCKNCRNTTPDKLGA